MVFLGLLPIQSKTQTCKACLMEQIEIEREQLRIMKRTCYERGESINWLDHWVSCLRRSLSRTDLPSGNAFGVEKFTPMSRL